MLITYCMVFEVDMVRPNGMQYLKCEFQFENMRENVCPGAMLRMSDYVYASDIACAHADYGKLNYNYA